MSLIANTLKWVVGLGFLFVGWEIAGQQAWLGKGLPPLTSIISFALEPRSHCR